MAKLQATQNYIVDVIRLLDIGPCPHTHSHKCTCSVITQQFFKHRIHYFCFNSVMVDTFPYCMFTTYVILCRFCRQTDPNPRTTCRFTVFSNVPGLRRRFLLTVLNIIPACTLNYNKKYTSSIRIHRRWQRMQFLP